LQFSRGVDLRGATYDRIDVKLTNLLAAMKRVPPEDDRADSTKAFDRHSYTQMSKALRAAGDDRRAEFVYVRQRRRELRNTWDRFVVDCKNVRPLRAARGFVNMLVDLVIWGVARYGVQPERLLILSIALIALGARIYSFEGAVVKKEPDPEAAQTATIKVSEIKPEAEPWTLTVDRQARKPENLDWYDSAKFSFSQFLPIVDVPSGSQWRPARDRRFWALSPGWLIPYDVYGTLHRVLGAILVPLLLAALAAALYRRFSLNA
jgi:hypothetical protein